MLLGFDKKNLTVLKLEPPGLMRSSLLAINVLGLKRLFVRVMMTIEGVLIKVCLIFCGGSGLIKNLKLGGGMASPRSLS